MDGVGLSHPCDLDPGNPCRDDGVKVLSTTNAKIAFFKGDFWRNPFCCSPTQCSSKLIGQFLFKPVDQTFHRYLDTGLIGPALIFDMS